MNERFDLIFKGELVPGCDLAQTKSNIANLFKIGPTKVEALFSGRPVVLKRNLDSNAANTYRVAIKNAGARVNLLESKMPVKQPASADSSDAPSGSAVNENGSSVITVQDVGENLLKPEERAKELDVIEIDLSHLSVRDLEGYLVDLDEVEREVAVAIEVPEASLTSLDELLLRPDERQQDVTANANLQNVDFSVAEPGAQLSEPKETTEQAPNTDHIKLLDS